jgi:hypothetical protein
MHVNCAVENRLITAKEQCRERTFNGVTAVFCFDHLGKAQQEIPLYGHAAVLKSGSSADNRFHLLSTQ